MGLILQKGPEREWWRGFIDRHEEEFYSEAWDEGGFLGVDTNYKFPLLQDPNCLANKLYTFLEEER